MVLVKKVCWQLANFPFASIDVNLQEEKNQMVADW